MSFTSVLALPGKALRKLNPTFLLKRQPSKFIPTQSARALSTKTDLSTKKPPTYRRPARLFAPFPGFDEFFTPSSFWKDPFDDIMPVLRNRDWDQDGMVLRHSSPGYEINETDNEYQIAIDVPGVKKEDMTIQLEDDCHVLHLSGGRKITKDGQTMETNFEKRFTISDTIDTANISADLSDGVLVVKAPKLPKEEVEPIKIQITEGKGTTLLEDNKPHEEDKAA